jgi:F0F1-type ATP synthase assembly protein I
MARYTRETQNDQAPQDAQAKDASQDTLNLQDKNDPQDQSKSSNISFGISIGMLVGIALGCWLDNLALWMCVGVSIGTAVGIGVKNHYRR